ncbi:sigma-54-dependent transcriptional regulator [Sphingomonas gellani]|uniref:sigma-54-dependent transcriptional regulator n=1 Tax=Sphingomonas gellani TaxID=1166340 RepID=UPI001FCDC62A|nr:response regulator [Sphingomonas gellani]
MSILLVDDNPHVADSLDVAVRLAGHALDRAEGPEDALSRLAMRRYDAVLLDMNYTAGRTNGAEGLALLSRIMSDDPGARVVVITAHSGIRIAVEAMRAGARDFVMKPWRNADLLAKLEAAAAWTAPAAASRSPYVDPAPAGLIGDSPAIARVRDIVRRVGPTMAGVLIAGPSGSGRGLVAMALHAASPHAALPMVQVDLRDPEAWARIDAADGTLLLRHSDRLGSVEQARLLDRLPDGARAIAIADDVAAIDPALARRIAAVTITVPSLAQRGEDALLLARHFARMAAERYGRPAPRLTPAAEDAVMRIDWPDQARGLAAAVERAVLLGEGDMIDAALLVSPSHAPAEATDTTAPSRFDLEENERAVIEAALREHHHNITHAATALGLSRGALYRRMERHGL